jgi:hypothetical protein
MTCLGTRLIGWEKKPAIRQQLFLMCLQTTYVICREHIASSKIIKYACECSRDMTVKPGLPTQWKYFAMLSELRGFMSECGSQATFS